MSDGETLWIESTRGPDDEPACLFTWGALRWHAMAPEVRQTAADMLTCAAYADMMMEMIGAGLDAGTVTAFASSLLNGQDKPFFGSGATVRLTPAGDSRKRAALVLMERGSRRHVATSAEAREMAAGWLTVAEGTESDQLVTEALRACGVERSTEEKVFGYLRKLREGAAR